MAVIKSLNMSNTTTFSDDVLKKVILPFMNIDALNQFAMANKASLKWVIKELKKRTVQKAPKIFATDNCTFIAAGNAMFACGENKDGQLSLSEQQDLNIFTPVTVISGRAKQIVTGNYHRFRLTNFGVIDDVASTKVYNQDPNTALSVRQLAGRINQLAIGGLHVMALTHEGLFVRGLNNFGQLGLGHQQNVDIFTLVTSLPGEINKIAAGGFFSLILTTEGLFGCGHNFYGELGLGHNEDRSIFTKLTPPPGEIKDIAAGNFFTLIHTSEGLFGCGHNLYGELGLDHNEDKLSFTKIISPPGEIKQIAAGGCHTFVATTKGFFSCGLNSHGQLGLNHYNNKNILTPVDFKPPVLPESALLKSLTTKSLISRLAPIVAKSGDLKLWVADFLELTCDEQFDLLKEIALQKFDLTQIIAELLKQDKNIIDIYNNNSDNRIALSIEQQHILSQDANRLADFLKLTAFHDRKLKVNSSNHRYGSAYSASIENFYKEAVTICTDPAKQVRESRLADILRVGHDKFKHRHSTCRLLADIIMILAIPVGIVIGVKHSLQGKPFFFSQAKTKRSEDLEKCMKIALPAVSIR